VALSNIFTFSLSKKGKQQWGDSQLGLWGGRFVEQLGLVVVGLLELDKTRPDMAENHFHKSAPSLKSTKDL
jgi:hypothetical protein